MIVTTDHGRGDTDADWTDHGSDVNGAEFVWLAAIGPDTPALGEQDHGPDLTQGQVASTVATLLGLDYRSAAPKAAPPILELFWRGAR